MEATVQSAPSNDRTINAGNDDESNDSTLCQPAGMLDADNVAELHKDSNSAIRRLQDRSDSVRSGDFVILVFSDGRQMLCQCAQGWPKGKAVPLKISKKTYPTHNIVGLQYGTVLEVGQKQLIPLPVGEDLIPEFSMSNDSGGGDGTDTEFSQEQARDNRHIVDDNTSQSLDYQELLKLKHSGVDGSTIVQHIIDNSTTFDQKTDFSKAK
jgi:tRNA (adenine58-N1)-methyltransferase non-catalytic subunit